MPLYFSAHSWAACWAIIALGTCVGCQPTTKSPPAAPTATGESATIAYEDPASIAFDPLPHHPRLELSNLRFSKGLGGAETFAIDWKLTSGQPHPGTLLVVKQPGRPMLEMSTPIWANETSGTIDGSVETFGSSSAGQSLASGCEMYLAALEGNVRHKISNSIVSGGTATSSTRQVTPEELAKLEKPSAQGLEDLPADVAVGPGTKLMMFSEGRFQSVTVVRSLADGGLRIKFDDHDFEGDFPRASLKVSSEVLAALPKQVVPQPQATTDPPTDAASPPKPTAGQTPPSTVGNVSEAELSVIPSDLKLPAGTRLRALYANQWKPVTVLSEQADGKIKIHWDGYSDSWDEGKSRSDLRIETATLNKLLAGESIATNEAPSPAPSDAGVELDPGQLRPGQKLEAQWGNRWLPVTVKRVLPGGVEIHWDGYQDSFDETLPLSKLRRPQ